MPLEAMSRGEILQSHCRRRVRPESLAFLPAVHLGAAPLLALCLIVAGTGCTKPAPPVEPKFRLLEDIVVYHRAETDRADQLSLEVIRLRADLRRAEEALVTVESGLRGNHTRANAVSALAEARVMVRRTSQQAPWRLEETALAESKLEEADLQIQQGNPGAALFFVYRAKRIAEVVLLEAKVVSEQSDTYFVTGKRVNLRAGPTTDSPVLRVLSQATPVFAERREDDWMLVRVVSGSAGWIHSSLIRR